MGDTRVAGERLAFDDGVWSDEVDRLTQGSGLTGVHWRHAGRSSAPRPGSPSVPATLKPAMARN